MKPRDLAILLTLLFTTPLAAESITTLQLQSRPAEEIVPIIAPLLEPGEKISGQGYRIFLRASPRTVEEVRALIAGIDIAPRSLMISIFQGREIDLEQRNISGRFRVENGDASVSITAGEARRNESGGPVHRLRVSEGSEGFIATGTRSGLFPLAEINAASGFYVLPRVNGERVTLQISSASSKLRKSRADIETLQATTTLSGRLGEWLPLGGVDQSVDNSRGDGFGRRSTRGHEQYGIWIRAELVR